MTKKKEENAPAKKKATTTAAFITGAGAVPAALFSFGGNTTKRPAIDTVIKIIDHVTDQDQDARTKKQKLKRGSGKA